MQGAYRHTSGSGRTENLVTTAVLTFFNVIVTSPSPTRGSSRTFPFKLYTASIRSFGISRSNASTFLPKSSDARRTVVFEGPLMLSFLKPPLSVSPPEPRDTWIDSIRSGSNGCTPISGIPGAKEQGTFSRLALAGIAYNSAITFGNVGKGALEHLLEAIVLVRVRSATLPQPFRWKKINRESVSERRGNGLSNTRDSPRHPGQCVSTAASDGFEVQNPRNGTVLRQRRRPDDTPSAISSFRLGPLSPAPFSPARGGWLTDR